MNRELAFPISQSSLKNLLVHPNFYRFKKENNTKEYSTAFSIGGAVDSMIISEEEFNKKYNVVDITYPSGKGLIMLNHMLTNLNGIYEEELLSAFKQADYAESTKFETIRVGFESKYKGIIDKLQEGKVILSTEQYNLVLDIVNSFKTNPFTQDYFNSKKYKIIDQLKINFVYLDKGCIAILDRVLIDKKNKTIRVIDWKTSSDSLSNFTKSIKKYGYDFQGAFYSLAIKAWADENGYKSYTILPYQLIVESTKYPGAPLIFELSGINIIRGVEKIRNTIDILMWHLDNDLWDYTEEIYKNNGIIQVDEL